jgi:hypothetical protein
MSDIYSLLVVIAALAVLVIGAVLVFRRRRIRNGYDEIRKHFGKDWS